MAVVWFEVLSHNMATEDENSEDTWSTGLWAETWAQDPPHKKLELYPLERATLWWVRLRSDYSSIHNF